MLQQAVWRGAICRGSGNLGEPVTVHHPAPGTLIVSGELWHLPLGEAGRVQSHLATSRVPRPCNAYGNVIWFSNINQSMLHCLGLDEYMSYLMSTDSSELSQVWVARSLLLYMLCIFNYLVWGSYKVAHFCYQPVDNFLLLRRMAAKNWHQGNAPVFHLVSSILSQWLLHKMTKFSLLVSTFSLASIPTDKLINPFTPESDQFQISPAASPEILHHTVWRTWLFIAYSDERWLYYQFSLPHLYISLYEGWENALLELGSERVKCISQHKLCTRGRELALEMKFISTLVKLHGHGNKCWPTEVMSNICISMVL